MPPARGALTARARTEGAAHLRAAFAAEERRGLWLATWLRLAAVVVIGCWLPVENAFPDVLFVEAIVIAFAVVGILPVALHGRAAVVARLALPLVDTALLAVAAFAPNPFAREAAFPVQLRLRFGNEVYLFLLLCTAAFSYSPRFVLWSGLGIAAVWTAIAFYIAALPDSRPFLPRAVWQALGTQEKLALFLDPRLVLAGYWGRVALVLVVTTAALAAVVWRSRRLVVRQAEAERQRTNLSRYFSPNVVEELAQADISFASTRTQDVTVLFADLVSFTALTERAEPAAVIDLLRAFHRRMQDAVFAHGGTLEKYLGDGVMATFGTPQAAADDAMRAFGCARAMLAAMAAWNAERAGSGAPPLGLGVGIHHGPVVLGDVGGPQRLEFAVVGDTVNVASRLERLTRELGGSVVASAAAVEAARRAGGDGALAGFRPGPTAPVRGRAGALAIWVLG